MRGRTLPILVAAAVVAIVPCGVEAQGLPTPTELLTRYVEAIGGAEATRKLVHRTVEMEMSAMGMTMKMKSWATAPDRLLSTVDMGGMGTVRTGLNGSVAWAIAPGVGASLLEGPQVEQLRQQADFRAQMDPSQVDAAARTVERTRKNGRDCHRVETASESGTSWTCFDVESGLLVAAGGRVETEQGVMGVETLLSEYRDFDGVRVPTLTTTKSMGQTMEARILSLSHAPIPPSTFELPPEVRALVKRP